MTFTASMSRFVRDRHVWVQTPLRSSLSMAALYFSCAALCLIGSDSSHASSSKGFSANLASAAFWWHLMTAAASLPSSRPTVSAQFSLFSASAAATSTVPAASPPRWLVVVVVVVVGGLHGPDVPVTSAPLGGPLLVGVGQARAKSLHPLVLRARLKVPPPGVAVAGEEDAQSVGCGPV